jgi:hypothetical protein
MKPLATNIAIRLTVTKAMACLNPSEIPLSPILPATMPITNASKTAVVRRVSMTVGETVGIYEVEKPVAEGADSR